MIMNMIKAHVLPMKNVTVCTFKTSPFVPAPRAHMFQHVCAWYWYTRGRFERTHGDVSSGHTAPHTTPHHADTKTPHGDRDRDRDKEREEKTEEQRQDKRREDKRRQDKTREERRFIFSVVVYGRFLLV